MIDIVLFRMSDAGYRLKHACERLPLWVHPVIIGCAFGFMLVWGIGKLAEVL